VCPLLLETVQKLLYPKLLVWGVSVVKTKVDDMISFKLTSDNVLVTDAWRAYKTYAKEKGIEHYLTIILLGSYLEIVEVKKVQYTILKCSYYPHSYLG
jgi:hypothetical protein